MEEIITRKALADELLDAWQHGPKAREACWLAVADKAIELLASRPAALLKPAPAEAPHDWQHVGSDGDAHTFQHGETGRMTTLEGFATWQEAAKYLDEPVPAEAEPETIDLDAIVERRERAESLLVVTPALPIAPAAEADKPRLAHDMPAPRKLSAEEMAQATEAGRELRESLDQQMAGMERVPASLWPLTARVERLEAQTTALVWSDVRTCERLRRLEEALQQGDAGKGTPPGEGGGGNASR